MSDERRTRAELIYEIKSLRQELGWRAEDVLKRYEFIVNTSRDLLSLINSRYEYEAVNNSYCAAFNKPREALISRSVVEVWGREAFERIIRKYLDRCFQGEDVQYTAEFEFASLGRRLMDVTYYPYRSAEGRVTHAVVVTRDITSYKRREDELLALKKAVETMQTGVTITNVKGEIEYTNPADAQMHGYGVDELLGQEVKVFAPTKFWKTRTLRGLSEITSWSREGMNRRKDGSVFPVQLKSDVVKNQQGVPIGIVTTCEDITQRKRAEEKIRSQLSRLTTLREIDMVILSSMDMKVVLNVLVNHLVERLGVDAAVVMKLDPHEMTLTHVESSGFSYSSHRDVKLRVGQALAGEVALERRPITIPNLAGGNYDSPFLKGEDFVFYYGMPLIAKGQVKGTLELFNRSQHNADSEWTDFMEALAMQAAIAIENATMFDDIQRKNMELMLAYDTTLEGWSHALDLRDRETEGHSRRVTDLTISLCREYGIGEAELVNVRRGAMLHDIGKMGVPDSILLKPESLSGKERSLMELHTVYAYEMLSPIAFLRPALDIPYCHHEKWDGGGYPRGLRGEQIPLPARIFAVVDVWDALLSDRPYRPAWPRDKVMDHIRGLSGTHFDPKVVAMFLSYARKI